MLRGDIDEWVAEVKAYLEKKTGRKDIEVTAGPYRSYDVNISRGTDGHPIVDFYSVIRRDARQGPAIAYALEMLQNWEANVALIEKARKDSVPFFEKLQAQFPDIELRYTVIDSEFHYVRVSKKEAKLVASFDLWPKMTDADVERIAGYIREHLAKVKAKAVTMSGVDYV